MFSSFLGVCVLFVVAGVVVVCVCVACCLLFGIWRSLIVVLCVLCVAWCLLFDAMVCGFACVVD